MAVSAKPQQKQQDDLESSQANESAIKAIIHRGGSTPKQDLPQASEPKRVQLRLYPEIIDDIDAQVEEIRRARRKPKFSRHKWLEEAIEEKLAKEAE